MKYFNPDLVAQYYHQFLCELITIPSVPHPAPSVPPSCKDPVSPLDALRRERPCHHPCSSSLSS